MAHRAGDILGKFVTEKIGADPEVDFTAADGVRHSSWTISDAEEIKFIERAFTGVQKLYIADGHHRSAAAARVFKNRNGAGGSEFFLSVIFPHDQVQSCLQPRLEGPERLDA